MEKGYYHNTENVARKPTNVAIHNKNGKGLLLRFKESTNRCRIVAIHNKNGKGLLQKACPDKLKKAIKSQSTIKMEKGYYVKTVLVVLPILTSQSTIKMEKGYYAMPA